MYRKILSKVYTEPSR